MEKGGRQKEEIEMSERDGGPKIPTVTLTSTKENSLSVVRDTQ